MYSLVISTIGAPFIRESLYTLGSNAPDDVIVVVDMVGRRAAPALEQEFPLADFEEDVRQQVPHARILYNEPGKRPWGVMNQCYNIGWRAAYSPFVWFTHDDIEYPDYDFPAALTPVLENIARDETIFGKRCVGLVLPEFEILNDVVVPGYPTGTWGLAQVVSPVSQIVSRQALTEMGGFDEVDGVWYDGQLQAETHIRDWWFVLLPTPLIRHTSNRTYRVNNWGDGWKANPIWGSYAENYERRYGKAWRRATESLLPMQPLTDPRYGVTP